MPQDKKIALVTGAASGIGFASAVALAREGVQVCAVARNEKRCREAKEKMDACFEGADVEFVACDLSSQASIRNLCREILGKYPRLDILVHAAGVEQSHFMTSEDGIEMQFAVNYLAPFILTHALLPSLLNSADARIILIGSVVHRHTRLKINNLQLKKGYTGYGQYKHTKLMDVMFAAEFNRRFQGRPIHAYAADPGYVNTGFGDKMVGLEGFFCRMFLKRGTPPEVPAKNIAFLALADEPVKADAVYWKDCKPLEPDPYVFNVDAAKKLWSESERFGMTGIWPEIGRKG